MDRPLVAVSALDVDDRTVAHEGGVERREGLARGVGEPSKVTFEKGRRRIDGARERRDAHAALRDVSPRQRVHVVAVDENQLLAVERAETEALQVCALHLDAVALRNPEAAFLDGRDAGVFPVLVSGRREAGLRERIQGAAAGPIQPVDAVAR